MPAEPKVAAKRGYTVEALVKGLRVLALFSETTTSLRISDIAARTGLPMPTTYRLVVTLTEEGFLVQRPDGDYGPSIKVLTLGYSALRGQALVELADGPLQRLATSLGETVNLGVLLGDKVLYLVRIRNADLVTANIQVGSTLPAVHTSMGKVLLAHLDAATLKEVVGTQIQVQGAGPNAVRTRRDLLAQLREVKERGFGLQDEELASGLRSISAPIFDSDGAVVAAANIAVQSSEWSTERIVEELGPIVVATCRDISQLLGHR